MFCYKICFLEPLPFGAFIGGAGAEFFSLEPEPKKKYLETEPEPRKNGSAPQHWLYILFYYYIFIF